MIISRRSSLNCVLITCSYHCTYWLRHRLLVAGTMMHLQPKRTHRSKHKGRPRINTASTKLSDLALCQYCEWELLKCPTNSAEERSRWELHSKLRRGCLRRIQIGSTLESFTWNQQSQQREKRWFTTRRILQETHLIQLRKPRNDAQRIVRRSTNVCQSIQFLLTAATSIPYMMEWKKPLTHESPRSHIWN